VRSTHAAPLDGREIPIFFFFFFFFISIPSSVQSIFIDLILLFLSPAY
jgi:hypothetical protein